MIFKDLPLPSLADNTTAAHTQNDVIFSSTRATYHYPAHTTPYLFIGNFKETGNYRVNKQYISVNDQLFYFLNPGDQLEISFKTHRNLETLLILFSDSFIKSWINFKHTPVNRLLDDGEPTPGYNFRIPKIPFEYNPAIINQIHMVRGCRQREELDTLLFGLLELFWDLNEHSAYHIDHIQAKRKSTREEIYKRLLLAKIFMQDRFADSPTIDEVAAEACLDKFHFLKLFRNYYGITPHQYLIKIKLERAHDLLIGGRYNVMQVCQLVGFESQGTFSNLFRKYYNVPPSRLSNLPDNNSAA